ncbi:hypothetical protein GPECTOR_38g277 [Gonium pectorale]|uniref:Phosphoglycerate mutase n=1 Tax=Gonium pectorale TaxID=33097 RepID=A0A150GCI0_GONPE|nr:hypothetical protein GPECTOR_38g277 [Gonium pectorale]|eukprot:KXZ47040.1 hypothetical protein GPECTOR_38g277 [Gonium pectorale]
MRGRPWTSLTVPLTQARFPFDTPLTTVEEEIHESAARLKSIPPIDVVYTSPFQRCIETAERLLRSLGRTDVPVFVHKGLSEVHNPRLLFRARAATLSQTARLWLWRASYQRRSRQLRERFPIKARVVESAWPQVPESELRASLRFHDTILDLAARHPGQQVLVVSHGRAVQVAHEALGVIGRALQVSYAGFVACRARPVQERMGAREGAAEGLRWEDYEPDPLTPSFGVESSYKGGTDFERVSVNIA